MLKRDIAISLRQQYWLVDFKYFFSHVWNTCIAINSKVKLVFVRVFLLQKKDELSQMDGLARTLILLIIVIVPIVSLGKGWIYCKEQTSSSVNYHNILNELYKYVLKDQHINVWIISLRSNSKKSLHH